VLGATVEGEVAGIGLDPMLGFFHRPTFGRPSLALDLLEELRPVVVDGLVLRLINLRQLTPADFEPAPRRGGRGASDEEPWLAEPGGEEAEGEGVYLSRTGRSVFLSALLERLRQPTVHPATGQVLELREIVRRQAWALARAVREGSPELYQGFRPRE
jgi:CRISPR-associated protein Cas1